MEQGETLHLTLMFRNINKYEMQQHSFNPTPARR